MINDKKYVGITSKLPEKRWCNGNGYKTNGHFYNAILKSFNSEYQEYIEKYGLDIKIIRLAQTFGAGVNLYDNRVFAQFAKSVIEKKDIILRKQERSKAYELRDSAFC